MMKRRTDVAKSDVVKSDGELKDARAGLLSIVTTRTRTMIKGYGLRYSRETEVLAPAKGNEGCDEGN
jgi:hypothetical protein